MAKEFLNTVRRRLTDTFNALAQPAPVVRKFELVAPSELPGMYHRGHGHTHYRIRALVDIPRHGVKAGDIGGLLQDERCLSHEGDCWLGGDAVVNKNVRIRDNALVSEQARLLFMTTVEGDAFVGGRTSSNMSAVIGGQAQVTGKTYIGGRSRIEGTARLQDAHVHGSARINEGAHTGNVFAGAKEQKVYERELTRLRAMVDAEKLYGEERKAMTPEERARTDARQKAAESLGKNVVRAGLGLPLRL